MRILVEEVRHSRTSSWHPGQDRVPADNRGNFRPSLGWPLPEQPGSWARCSRLPTPRAYPSLPRSEEHTSELQSLMRISYAVFCLKKKKTHTTHTQTPIHKLLSNLILTQTLKHT